MIVEPTSFTEITVNTHHTRYPVYVGSHLLQSSTLWEPLLKNKPVLIVSDQTVAPLYLAALHATCTTAQALKIDHLIIPPGEHTKSLSQAQAIWEEMLERQYHRDLVMIALGGGVIGDITGFCGSCYHRGVTVIQCPTTLLSQVDASIGGKTGINTPQGKNVLGTFYQPHAVVADISTLQTLDERAFRAGIAELIKYGLTLSADFFEWMEVHLEAILRRETVALNTAITQAAQFKAQVVMQDETDMKGIRRILNFGHTLAHAIETLLGYQHILHGEAVAIGMVFALKLSVQYIGLSSNIVVRLERMLRQAQLPTQIPSELARSELWSKIKQDKKYLGQALPWVLLKNLGQVAPPQVISQAQFLAIE